MVRCIVLVALAFQLPSFLASAAADGDLDDKRRFLVAGMKAGREILKTGHVVILGKHHIDGGGVHGFTVPVRYEIFFDLGRSLYRCTQSDYAPHDSGSLHPDMASSALARSDLPRGVTSEGLEWVTREIGGTIVHTTEYDLHRALDSLSVTRHSPGTVAGTTVKEWDVRTFGIVDWAAFTHGVKNDNLLNALESQLKCTAVDSGESGISSLTLCTSSTEYELWIDEVNGMTPVSMIRREIKESMRQSSNSTVTWKNNNDVWVPVSFHIDGELTRGLSEGYDLTMEWIQVNEDLDPKWFTPAGVTESESAVIADMRLGQIVMERVVQRKLPDAVSDRVEPKRPTNLGWIVSAHVVVIVAIAFWYYRKRVIRQEP